MQLTVGDVRTQLGQVEDCLFGDVVQPLQILQNHGQGYRLAKFCFSARMGRRRGQDGRNLRAVMRKAAFPMFGENGRMHHLLMLPSMNAQVRVHLTGRKNLGLHIVCSLWWASASISFPEQVRSTRKSAPSKLYLQIYLYSSK